MELLDILNIFVSAISIVLAIVALWLSIYFYQQSKKDADTLSKASTDIAASVVKLEKLFDTLYSDTFSMMRETVTDMRTHIWSRPDSLPGNESAGLQSSLDSVREELMDTLETVTRRMGVTETDLRKLRAELQPAIDRAIDETQDLSLTQYERNILDIINSADGKLTVLDIEKISHINRNALPDVIFSLRKKGRITWSGDENALSFKTTLSTAHPQS